MSVSIPDPPNVDITIPKTKDEATDSLSSMQSAEQGYHMICVTALDTIKSFLDHPGLGGTEREELKQLLPKIQAQKDKIVELTWRAKDTLYDSVDDTDTVYDAETIAAFEETVEAFTATTQELNRYLDLMTALLPGDV